MTYSVGTRMKNGGGLEFGVQWKDKFDPVAVCQDSRDAQKICDALNKAEHPLLTTEGTKIAEAWNWIRVEDLLPDDEAEVLVLTKKENLHLAYRMADHWYESGTCTGVRIASATISHWCDPIPPADLKPNT